MRIDQQDRFKTNIKYRQAQAQAQPQATVEANFNKSSFTMMVGVVGSGATGGGGLMMRVWVPLTLNDAGCANGM